MPGYQWKGTYQGPDLFDATTRPKPQPVKETKPARQLQPCGTRAAYTRHLRHHEQPCDACSQAWSDYLAEYRKARTQPSKPRQEVLCGTYSGYAKHHYKGEKPCRECQDAKNAYQREWSRKGSAA